MSQSYPDGSDIPALPEAAKMKRSTNMEQRVVHMTVHGLFQEASGKGMVGKHRGELEAPSDCVNSPLDRAPF